MSEVVKARIVYTYHGQRVWWQNGMIGGRPEKVLAELRGLIERQYGPDVAATARIERVPGMERYS